MRKGYKETLPKTSHDPDNMPIWGAPVAPSVADSPAAKRTKRQQDREDKFREQAKKPVPWQQNMRLGNGRVGGYDYLNLEALYKGFRSRLLDDPSFEAEVLELIMDRIMTELFVPMSHTPRKGLKLKICRKEVSSDDH